MRSNTSFAQRLFLLLIERGAAALNILLNSILVARLLSPEAAATYFFVGNVAQIAMSPWVPAAEIAWIGAGRLGAPAASERSLVEGAAGLTIFAGGFVAVTGTWYLATKGGDPLMLLAILVANLVYVVVLLLLPSKYGHPRRFLATMLTASLSAVAVKVFLLSMHAQSAWTGVLLFTEFFIAALLSVTPASRREKAPASAAGARTASSWVRPIAASVTSVIAVLLAGRAIMLVAGSTLRSSEFVTFGLAFQFLNAASFLGSALSGSTTNELRKLAEEGKPAVSRVVRLTAAVSCLAGVGAIAGMIVVGHLIMGLLLGERAKTVYPLVFAGLPASVAVLLQSVAFSLAAVGRRMQLFTLLSLLGSCGALVAFYTFPGPLELKVAAWSWSALLWTSIHLAFMSVLVRSEERRRLAGVSLGAFASVG